ncbi:HNH endonuclease [Hymenobacter sp. DG01]|uniref:HNH endonuclease n=1 Tax=Hymenobacter sp. DG01 TaxID=2584940 RepID=UPI0015DD97AF|nr:HNH endonuclease [Hymenobacter sp. DG01]
MSFIPNDDVRNTHVIHINGDRTDNRAENLRYGHQWELTAEILKLGIQRKNQLHNNPRNLSREDVQLLHSAYATGATAPELAEYYGISNHAVNSNLRYNTHTLDVALEIDEQAISPTAPPAPTASEETALPQTDSKLTPPLTPPVPPTAADGDWLPHGKRGKALPVNG